MVIECKGLSQMPSFHSSKAHSMDERKFLIRVPLDNLQGFSFFSFSYTVNLGLAFVEFLNDLECRFVSYMVEQKRMCFRYHAGGPEYWIVKPKSHTVEELVLEHSEYRSIGIFGGQAMLPSRI